MTANFPQQTCPRRMEGGPWKLEENQDSWNSTGSGPSCSFCGSLHPDRFMELARGGWTVGPTDKTYKVYLSSPEGEGDRKEAKFYFQHLSVQQQDEFIDLVNSRSMKIGYPGHFYVLPFFCGRPEPK